MRVCRFTLLVSALLTLFAVPVPACWSRFPARPAADAGTDGAADGAADAAADTGTDGSPGCGNQVCEQGSGETVDVCPEDCGWVDISAGNLHTCAVKGDGTAFCWGSNSDGQLGSSAGTGTATPTQVQGLEDVVQISTGMLHTCAVTRDASAFCWGNNDEGQLGDGNPGNTADTPQPVATSRSVVRIDAGGTHTCAVDEQGGAMCWGADDLGKLGRGVEQPSPVPADVAGLQNVIGISASYLHHTCAVDADGDAWCWGSNNYGLLGENTGSSDTDPHPTPSRVNVTGVVQEVIAGRHHHCVRLGNGQVLCWGDNDVGQVGLDCAALVFEPTVTGDSTDNRMIRITTFQDLNCAVRDTDKQVFCWGENRSGAVGVPGAGNPADVTWVESLGGAMQVSAGWEHTCAVTPDGRAHCWGNNLSGQVGDGTFDHPRTIPTPVLDPYP